MGPYFAFRSNFDIFQRDKEHHPVRILQSVQFQIIRASWLDTVRIPGTGRQAEQTSEILNSGNLFFFFRFGERRTKRVRPTGKSFDDILTGDHRPFMAVRDIGDEEQRLSECVG